VDYVMLSQLDPHVTYLLAHLHTIFWNQCGVTWQKLHVDCLLCLQLAHHQNVHSRWQEGLLRRDECSWGDTVDGLDADN